MNGMQIVVLDGYTLNPGDLSWDALQSLGACRIHDRTPDDDAQVLARAGGAQVLLTNKTMLSARVIEQLDGLRYIGVLATGVNVVDVAAARARGIPVTNVPGYGPQSVAQMAFAHVLNLTQRVGHHAQTVREGRWSACPDFCYWDYPLVELAGLTMGIVGLGRIGQRTAAMAQAFGMQVQGYDAVPPASIDGVRLVDLDTLFRTSDVISLHCPLTAQTERLVDRRRLEQMKPTALLVNTARGQLIDERALAEALNSGRIAGAGLDVLCEEPPPAEHPLYTARHCFITPHISWATSAARRRLMEIAVENVRAFLQGRPQNVVNP